jgi:transposase-like protein
MPPRHGVAPNQLFTWRRLVAQGALTAAGSGEEVVPASDYRALQARCASCNDCQARCASCNCSAGRRVDYANVAAQRTP